MKYLNDPPKDGNPEPKYKRDIITIDWDEIRRKRLERLEQEAAAGVDNDEVRQYLAEKEGREFVPKSPTPKKKPPRKKPGPSQRGANLRGRKPINQLEPEKIEQFVRLYEAGVTVPAIAKQLGNNPGTVRDYLKERGVYDAERDRRKGGMRRNDG